MMDWENLWPLAAKGLAVVVLFMALFVLAKWLRNQLTPYDIQYELTSDDNVAQAIAMGGYYIGFTIVFCGAYLGPTFGIFQDLMLVCGYSLLGLLLLNLARRINDYLMLHKMSMVQAIEEHHNLAAGTLLGCNYIAAGLVVAGAIHGEGGVGTALVFFVIGQLALVLFAVLYEVITPYSLRDEIVQGNLAAALGFGGTLIAIGVLVMGAVSADFVSWTYNLGLLATEIIAILVYLVAVRLFFDKVLIRGSDLNLEIARDKNVGAGLLEFAVALSFSVLLFFVIG